MEQLRLLLHPVVLGGGKPFFPPLDSSLRVDLVETKTFSSGVVYLRYATSR